MMKIATVLLAVALLGQMLVANGQPAAKQTSATGV